MSMYPLLKKARRRIQKQFVSLQTEAFGVTVMMFLSESSEHENKKRPQNTRSIFTQKKRRIPKNAP